MTSKERLLAAWRCQEVDYVPMAWHFWPSPLHAQATWHSERERLEFYRRRWWDARVEVETAVTPLPEVRTEVRYETDRGGPVLHQVWHTPAGSVSERLRVTEDWPPPNDRQQNCPMGFRDDFRTSRYVEFPFKSAADLATLPYLFPLENAQDAQRLVQQHREARMLADEFQIPFLCYHPAGMDWLVWLYPAEEAIIRAQTEPDVITALLDHINRAYFRQLQLMLQLGVDGVCRRGWYESADLWSPKLFVKYARGPLEQDIRACHSAGGVFIYLMDSGVVPLLGEAAHLDFDCLFGVDPATSPVDLRRIRQALPGKSLWGGISGPLHIGRGSPSDAEGAVERAFDACGRAGFVLGLGVGIRYNWPWENVEACDLLACACVPMHLQLCQASLCATLEFRVTVLIFCAGAEIMPAGLRRARHRGACLRLRQGTAARSSRFPAKERLCAGRDDRPRHWPDAGRRQSRWRMRASAHSRSTSMLSPPVKGNRQLDVEAELSGGFRQRLQSSVKKCLGGASRTLDSFGIRQAPSVPRGRTDSPAAHRRRRERVAARWPRSRFSTADRREAGHRPASPAPRWRATESYIRALHSRGSADRTSGTAWAHSGRRSRRRAPRACDHSRRCSLPTYWAIVPRHETGNVRNRVSSRAIVESFADVPPGGEQDPILVLGNGCQASDDRLGLLGPRAAAKHDKVANAGRQLSRQVVEMLIAFRQHQRRAAFPDGLHDVVADDPIALVVRDKFTIEIVELDSHIRIGCLQLGKRRWDGPAQCAEKDARRPAPSRRRGSARGHIA